MRWLQGNRRLWRNQQGVALVLALLAISFMVAITVNLIRTVDWQVQSSGSLRNRLAVDNALLSGLNIARAVLVLDQKANTFDSPYDEWATLDQERLTEIAGGVSLKVEVFDLGGKLQINALVSTQKSTPQGSQGEEQEEQQEQGVQEDQESQEGQSEPGGQGGGTGGAQDTSEQKQQAMWLRFLDPEQFAIEDTDQATAILNALIDWVDQDDTELDNGAEDDYYQSLNPAYSSRNGTVRYLEELHLVKGMEPSLLDGDEEHKLGIIEYLTIADQKGKVNINTAPEAVLRSLDSELDEEMVSAMIAFRKDEDNKDALANLEWYGQVEGVPGDIKLDPDLVTVQSDSFLVVVTASLDSLQREGSAVVHRKENFQQEILFWKVE